MFKMFSNLTKSALGIVLSPISIAADLATMGGAFVDREEPFTVTTFRHAMRNLELAFDPEELSDEQVREIIAELNRRRGK